MAFNVDFYVFSKKTNSTARPSATPETYSCVLKEDSSIAAPVILLNLGLQTAPAWNYCYIAAYNRYYFVNNWTWTNNRLWQAELTTDLLATFKDQIGAASLYVLRCAYASDGNIVDDYYPAKTNCITQVTTGISPWIHTDESDDIDLTKGVFVVGYVTSNQPNNSHMYGSVVYSAMEQSGLRAMVDELLDNNMLEQYGFDLKDATLALQKSLIDPLSYIKSCIWLPIMYSGIAGTELQAMHIWDWTINAPHKIISNDPPYQQYVRDLTIVKHPLTLTRGNYLNTSPYTRINMDFPPFGNIEIDTSLSANATIVRNIIIFDMITGTAIDRIYVDDVLTDVLTSQIGVPIQLSQVTRDYLGAAQSSFNGIMGIAGGIISKDAMSAISSAGNGIANAVRAMQPRNSSIGSTGSFSSLARRPRLYHQFMTPVDEDNEHSGRPLCQIRQISTIPGYIMVKDGELDLPALAGEEEEVRAYLEGGFFYG